MCKAAAISTALRSDRSLPELERPRDEDLYAAAASMHGPPPMGDHRDTEADAYEGEGYGEGYGDEEYDSEGRPLDGGYRSEGEGQYGGDGDDAYDERLHGKPLYGDERDSEGPGEAWQEERDGAPRHDEMSPDERDDDFDGDSQWSHAR